jgi:hypothetical protein
MGAAIRIVFPIGSPLAQFERCHAANLLPGRKAVMFIARKLFVALALALLASAHAYIPRVHGSSTPGPEVLTWTAHVFSQNSRNLLENRESQWDESALGRRY